MTIPREWRVALASLVGLAFSLGPLLVLTFGIFVKPLAREFHTTRGSISAAASVLEVVITFAAPVAGWLVDRHGARRVLLPSIVALAACIAALGAVHRPLWHLYVLFGLAGLTGVAVTPVSYTRVVANWFDRRRGLALGLAGSGVGVGALIVPPLTERLVERAGFRTAYVSLAVLSVVVAVPVVALFIRDPDAPRDRERRAEPEGVGVRKALTMPALWLMCVVFFFVAACVQGTVAHLVPLLTDRGVPGKTAALAVSVYGVTTTAGRVGSGWLVDRFEASRVASLLFAGAGLGIAALWTGAGGASPFVAAALLGLAMGAETDVMPYFVSRIFGRHAMAGLFGFVFGSFTLGIGAGRALFGAGFDRYGSYHVPLAWAAILTLVASVLTLGLRVRKSI